MTGIKIVERSLIVEDLLKRDMSYDEIIRDLYRITKDEDYFSSDDYRIENYNWNKHTNSIGAFFLWLNKEGYAIRFGFEKSILKSNKGREIKTWQWTDKVKQEFA